MISFSDMKKSCPQLPPLAAVSHGPRTLLHLLHLYSNGAGLKKKFTEDEVETGSEAAR